MLKSPYRTNGKDNNMTYEIDALNDEPVERVAFSISQFCHWANIERTKYYELVKAGEIKPRAIGGKRIILVDEAKAWLAALPEAY